VAFLLLVFRVLPPPPEPRRADDDPVQVPDAQIRKMRKMSLGIHNLLGRWTQVSNQSRSSIEEVQSHVDEVIRISESSVVEIGKKFVAVTRKTRSQVDHALALLEHTQTGNAQRESRPLPELVTAYEELLSKITETLAKVAETAEQLERRHESVREDFRHVDTLLDQLSAHDSQIGMMALNTSVSAATSSSDVVSVSDQIRTLSLESKALTRDIRRTLEQVRSQHQQTHGAVRQSVQQARDAAAFASAEAAKLGREMLFNGQEVAETLSAIGALGNEIQKDINDIIVALQYQDITQQKLQRLKNPLLTDLRASLRVIFDETRVLSTKLEGSGLVDQTSTGTFRVALASGAEGSAAAPKESPNPDAQAAPVPEDKPQGRRKGDEAVEIF
jgi:methyl-accepting chemotaxis protein